MSEGSPDSLVSLCTLTVYEGREDVYAGKIVEIVPDGEDVGKDVTWLWMRDATDCDECYGVDDEWLKQHQPELGGYFILHKDGRQDYSPAAAFEAKHTASLKVTPL